MSQSTKVTQWTWIEIVVVILAVPATIAALIKIQGALRKCYRRQIQDIELGRLSAVQIESDLNSMSAPQQGVVQPLGREDLASDILQPSSIRVQPLEQHDRSVLRLRHHMASVPEGVSSSVTTIQERKARIQESRVSIGTNLEDWLEIRTEEAKDQIAREKTEWQEVSLSRNAPIATSSSWPDLNEGLEG